MEAPPVVIPPAMFWAHSHIHVLQMLLHAFRCPGYMHWAYSYQPPPPHLLLSWLDRFHSQTVTPSCMGAFLLQVLFFKIYICSQIWQNHRNRAWPNLGADFALPCAGATWSLAQPSVQDRATSGFINFHSLSSALQTVLPAVGSERGALLAMLSWPCPLCRRTWEETLANYLLKPWSSKEEFP